VNTLMQAFHTLRNNNMVYSHKKVW